MNHGIEKLFEVGSGRVEHLWMVIQRMAFDAWIEIEIDEDLPHAGLLRWRRQ